MRRNGEKMDLSKLAEIISAFTALQTQITELQAKLTDIENFVAAEKQASFEAGVLSKQSEIDALNAKVEELNAKIAVLEAGGNQAPGFTQEQVDLMLEPLQKKIAELEVKAVESDAKIIELEQKILDLNLQKELEIKAAIEAIKAEMVADFEASQVDDAAFLAKYKV